MTDGIIKSTGNSRYLKSVANILALYPTYEAFADALAAGTFPIDLNGINPAGWETVGNKLDKATLLTDALCTALGLAATATPTQAMDKLRQLISTVENNGVKTQVVSYVGTGTYGEKGPCSVTFTFAPAVAIMLGFADLSSLYWNTQWNYTSAIVDIACSLLTTDYVASHGFGYGSGSYGKISSDRKTLTWYSVSSADRQANKLNTTYYCLGIS